MWIQDHSEIKQFSGKRINYISLDSDAVIINFIDGSVIRFTNYQSCCESRYFQTDDNLDYYRDCDFYDIEINGSESEDSDYGCHDIGFFDIRTSNGVLTFANHNEHNGYYGGISLQTSIELPEKNTEDN